MKHLFDTIRRVRVSRPTQPDLPATLEGLRVLLIAPFETWDEGLLLAPIVQAILNAGARPPVGIVTRPPGAKALKLFELPVKAHPLPDELMLPKDHPKWAEPGIAAAATALSTILQKRHYDVVADLAFFEDVDTRRWVHAAEADVRLGFGEPGELEGLHRLTVCTEDDRGDESRHWSADHLRPLRPLGLLRPDYTVAFTESDAAKSKAAAKYEDGPKVLLCPHAVHEDAKDPERFARIAHWVHAEAEGSAVLAGPPEFGKALRRIAKTTGAEVYVQKDLGGLQQLAAHADVVVAEAPGPMQLGFLLNKPTVAILDDLPLAVWGPPVPDTRFVLMGPLESAAEGIDMQGIRTRAILHYLDGLIARYAAG